MKWNFLPTGKVIDVEVETLRLSKRQLMVLVQWFAR